MKSELYFYIYGVNHGVCITSFRFMWELKSLNKEDLILEKHDACLTQV